MIKKVSSRLVGFVLRKATAPSDQNRLVSTSLNWEELCEREAAQAVVTSPPDYKLYHQAQASKWRDLTGRSVVVVGCN